MTEPRTAVMPRIAVYASRERVRLLARTSFPRRRCRLVIARGPAEFSAAFRDTLVDAALVDLGGTSDEGWRLAELAREFPSVPFFGAMPLRPGDGPALARCTALDFTDVIIDAVDDGAARGLIMPHLFSTRFAAALAEPPAPLGISTPMQRQAWAHVVAQAGRGVRTSSLAHALGVTREHLSRTFAADGAPNLKRIIDLVRLIAAAELAKNPGYDVRDVARVLGFASSSHLSTTAQRVIGTKPASLSRLRTVDLFDRFVRGRGRSRA